MTLQQAIKTLELHQQWRLGLRDDFYPKPKEITEALNVALDALNEVKKPCVHPYASVTGEDHGNPYCLECRTKLSTQ
jgi:hypothetical protein